MAGALAAVVLSLAGVSSGEVVAGRRARSGFATFPGFGAPWRYVVEDRDPLLHCKALVPARIKRSAGLRTHGRAKSGIRRQLQAMIHQRLSIAWLYGTATGRLIDEPRDFAI